VGHAAIEQPFKIAMIALILVEFETLAAPQVA
jgi:hypothetical protein